MIGVVWGGAPKHEKLIGGTMMKKTFALLLAAVMMLALLTACGGGDKPADTFMTTYRNALQEILEGKGYQVTVVDGNNDQAKQNEQINTFITQGVDALIINPVMTSAADTIIATVKSAGIPTVLINREPTADQMAAYDKLVYVGCDAAQSGTFQGELILDTPNKGDINGDGKVSYIMIQGDPENIVNEDIYLVGVDALDAALNEVSNGNMTGTVLNDANGQAAGAVAEMEKLLGGATYASGEQSVYVDYVKVTPDNVGDFMK